MSKKSSSAPTTSGRRRSPSSPDSPSLPTLRTAESEAPSSLPEGQLQVVLVATGRKYTISHANARKVLMMLGLQCAGVTPSSPSSASELPMSFGGCYGLH